MIERKRSQGAYYREHDAKRQKCKIPRSHAFTNPPQRSTPLRNMPDSHAPPQSDAETALSRLFEAKDGCEDDRYAAHYPKCERELIRDDELVTTAQQLIEAATDCNWAVATAAGLCQPCADIARARRLQQ